MIDNNWRRLKKKIYFEDGSLRDILIDDFSIEENELWLKLVYEKYNAYIDGKPSLQMSFDDISNSELSHTLSFKLDDILINSILCPHDEGFENDIDPKEFKSIRDHEIFLEYLIWLSNTFKKTVRVTWQNMPDWILFEVKQGIVTFHVK